jgi:ABC-2 type transport system permease protein
MQQALVLALKDLRLLWRNRGSRFFVFFWPLITAVMFGFLFSGGGGGSAKPKLAVVDLDATPAARQLIDDLRKIEMLEVDTQAETAARDLVRTGKRTAAVLIPAGFGAQSRNLFYGTPPTLDVLIDPSRRAERAMIEGMLQHVAGERMQRMLTTSTESREWLTQARTDVDQLPEAERAQTARFLDSLDQFLAARPAAAPGATSGAAASAGWQPMMLRVQDVQRQRSGPVNAFGVTFPQGMLWGMVGVMMTFATMLVLERVQGTLVRLRASPMSAAQILLGKGLACALAIALVTVALTVLAVVAFKVRPSSYVLLGVAILACALAFSGIMMTIASLGSTTESVSGVGWAIMMPLMMLGGGMIPLFVMPGWLAQLSSVSPVKWGILALEGAIWRNFTLAEMALPLAILAAVGLAGLWFGARRVAARAV